MIEKILQRQNDNGGQFWSRVDGDIHAPFGFSTIDTLSVLGEIGYSINDNSQIANAIDFIFSYQTPEGCFKYSPKSKKVLSHESHSAAKKICRYFLPADFQNSSSSSKSSSSL